MIRFAFLYRKERVKEIVILYLEWEICDETIQGVERYCPHCNRKVIFTDSDIKRRNANGKDIYEFAIFKCPEDHTWNRLLKTYQAKDYIETANPKEIDQDRSGVINIHIGQSLDQNISEVRICLQRVSGQWRLDKLLALHIVDWSRTKIEKQIRSGKILLNDKVVPTRTIVRTGQVIRILIES